MNNTASQNETAHFTVMSTREVPLTLNAADWRAALCMALQVLGLEAVVSRLKLRVEGALVVAEDPVSGDRFMVERIGRHRTLAAA